MHKKNTFLIYLLSLIIFPSTFSMQLTKAPSCLNKKFIRTAIGKSAELDAMRKKWRSNDSPQEVVDISQGKIVIKEKISLGKRYGTCHNYAFTKLMGIVGKASVLLNILGQRDYYGDDYLKGHAFFDILEPKTVLQPGDLIVYLSQDEKGKFDDVTHTGIVIGDDCIESKWGSKNVVFQHPIWYIPESFGNHCRYLRLKMSGPELLVKIQQRLQKKEIKDRYDVLAWHVQQKLFDDIKQYEQDRSSDNLEEIYETLECHMNVHLDVPDKNGVTPLMHAERIGCEKLKELFASYQAHRE